MNVCRACGAQAPRTVLDVGSVPAADHFPPAGSSPSPGEAGHRCVMTLCLGCGLAQLADDDTVTAEPRGVEPRALVAQADAAITDAAAAGLLSGGTVTEFGSPHGGTWIPQLTARGYRVATGGEPADLVVDSFGIMHEPDQRAAFAARAAAVAPGGVLLIQFHSLAAIVADGGWNALRHGHFAYYSTPVAERLLAAAGLRVVDAWRYDLYGGTVMVAAVPDGPRSRAAPTGGPERFRAIVDGELRVDDPAVVASLQTRLDRHVDGLRAWLREQAAEGRSVYAYGAASRAVAVLHLCRPESETIVAVADASPAKQGRRMPGTSVPIVSPEALSAAAPDRVLLMLPDLLPEVSARLPALAGRWIVDGPDAYHRTAGGAR